MPGGLMQEMDQLDGGRLILGDPNEELETISKDELYEKLRRHEPLQVVNVLDPKYYELGFIRGSLRIPLYELDDRLMELDKNKEIITYCANYDCHASLTAAKILKRHGFCARAYEGGIEEWKGAGLAVEGQ
jgi:rhodanese-related sulfurtransferase